MDTITLKVKTTKPTQEIEFRFSETRSSKPIQFEIDWGDGTLNIDHHCTIMTDPICTTPQVGDHIINLNWNPKVNQQIMDQVGIDILHRKRELPY